MKILDKSEALSGLKKLIGHELIKSIPAVMISAVVSASLSYMVSMHTSKLSAQLTDQNKTISDFQADARSVDTSLQAYAYGVIQNGRPNESVAQNLRQNLLEQYEEVDSVEPYIRPKHRNLVPAYKQQIIEMTKVIPETTNVLNMKEYWEAASKLLTLRDQINSNLPS